MLSPPGTSFPRSDNPRSRSRSPETGDENLGPVRRRGLTRRRAPTACQLCRQRKTRCDNRRPTCGFCSFNQTPCVYTEDRQVPQARGEPSNSVILERIEHAISLLESQGEKETTLQTDNHHASNLQHQTVGADEISLDPPGQGQSDFTDAGFGQLEISERAASNVSCEAVLRWPIFDGLVPNHNIKSLLLVSGEDTDISSPEWPSFTQPKIGARSTLGSDDILPLCKKFQLLILVKNPFMTASDFARYAREIAENGPGWDGPSCLVLLACALACLATPFCPTGTTENTSYEQHIPLADYVDKVSAEAYYMAAQKRIGLLQNSLIAVQCYYFAGLFEKFSLRPLKAWTLFHQACIHFQAGIWKRVNSSFGNNSATTHRTRHFEQRLYWSCVKAECEIRAEIQFPSSGLLKFKYPENFPALSMPEPHQQAETSSPNTQENIAGHSDLDTEVEKSWLYYLAEISLRGIMNRILEGFYSEAEESWIRNIRLLLGRFDASHEELLLWRSHLPKPISFNDTSAPQNELAFQLQSRYYYCHEWIHRPFLYCALFGTSTHPYVQRTFSLASKCLEYAVKTIGMVSHPHRFGGTWTNTRRSFSSALLLLASARSGKLILPSDWEASIALSLQTLSNWESEAADLRWCRQILEGISNNIARSPTSGLQQ